MTDLGVPFHLTEVDGVPCFWADAPGPCSAGLLFRVGRADETLAGAGITQLVQRLALSSVGHQRYEFDGRVDTATTAFYATGEPTEVVSFLWLVCGALRDLPLEAIDTERRVLQIEDQREPPTLTERLLMMRFGATGYGLPFYEALGLRTATPERAAAWAAQWFTRGNAVLWITRPPPRELRLALPDGLRVPPPAPLAMRGLELPVFAAAGNGVVASAMVAPRTAAIGVAGRTVAGRVQVQTGLDAATWQFPLAGDLTHRSLSVEFEDDRAAEVTAALAGAYDAIASDGPAREEIDAAGQAVVAALADDEATAGGLDRMAVAELLGTPRLWKEDLAREAQGVSYAEVVAALREALTTQILVAPANVANPDGRRREYPWFSHERVKGSELKPLGRSPVRLVVSQEGVSHVATDSGRASTVRFADVAAAVQEPDGSLTLIGRDGAAVPIDPHAFRGAGQVVADLERTLPPDLVVPPRETGRLDQLARRKLRVGARVEAELQLLRDRLDHDEQAVTMSEAAVGYMWGLLVVTDRRVVFVHRGDRRPVVRELPYSHVLGVKFSKVPSHVVTLNSPVGETAFSSITPKERGPEIHEQIEWRAAEAQAAAQARQ
jgi:hypothetical protein